MLIVLISLVLGVALAVTVLFAVVRAGVRAEDQAGDLADRAPTPLTGLTRRLLGLHVRRPALPAARPGRDECDDAGLTACTYDPNGGEAA